jgi:hypothetical protein
VSLLLLLEFGETFPSSKKNPRTYQWRNFHTKKVRKTTRFGWLNPATKMESQTHKVYPGILKKSTTAAGGDQSEADQ